MIALVSPPLALFIYISFRFAGYRQFRLQLAFEVGLFGNTPQYERYASDTTPYVSVTAFSASVFAPLGSNYFSSYLCSAGLVTISTACAGATLTAVNAFL